jgi:hypothetical protein
MLATTIVLEDSRLNTNRFNTSQTGLEPENTDPDSFNSKLNVSEAGLNELLTNITFSLMSLDLFNNNITVNATEYLNTYEFSRPINLVLPYALCLAFGLLIVALGLLSLWQNGVPATEGFMQIMMATRGRTEMERLVLEQEMSDSSKATEVLRELKIRYGELVTEDAVEGRKMQGFGTAGETVSLRKRRS